MKRKKVLFPQLLNVLNFLIYVFVWFFFCVCVLENSVQLKHMHSNIYLFIQFDCEKFISKILPYRQYKMFLSTVKEQ